MKRYIGIFKHKDEHEDYFMESESLKEIKDYANANDDDDYIVKIYEVKEITRGQKRKMEMKWVAKKKKHLNKWGVK